MNKTIIALIYHLHSTLLWLLTSLNNLKIFHVFHTTSKPLISSWRRSNGWSTKDDMCRTNREVKDTSVKCHRCQAKGPYCRQPRVRNHRITLPLLLLHDFEIFVICFLGYSHNYPMKGYRNQGKIIASLTTDASLEVHAVIFDGCSKNLATSRALRCKLENFYGSFQHP